MDTGQHILYHPKTLELLLQHKNNGGATLSLALLALITDYTSFIDIEVLYGILYSYTSRGSVAIIKKQLFAHAATAEVDGLCCCVWPQLPSDIKELVVSNRAGAPRRIGMGGESTVNFVDLLKVRVEAYDYRDGSHKPDGISSDAMGDQLNLSSQLESTVQDTPKRKRRSLKNQPVQSNVLNFKRTEPTKVDKIERFAPIKLGSGMFVYDKRTISHATLRRRDDLRRPVKLQFIKHYDQRRPPIYQVRGRIVKWAHSYERLPEVISYEECSSDDWEEQGAVDAISINSDEDTESADSTSSAEDADSMISADSASSVAEVPKRNTKKPVFSYDKISIEVYFPENEYKDAPLEGGDVVPAVLVPRIRKRYGDGVPVETIAKLYNIDGGAITRCL